jgi:predicted amidohydrolase
LATLHRVQKMLAGRRLQKGDWLIFPEMWPGGFLVADRVRQEVENAFCFHWLKQFARAKGCYLAGSMLEVKNGRFFNSAYLIDPEGRLLSHYRKIHLFRLGEEHRKFKAGRKVALARLPWAKLGMAICYDLRFPELFRIYARLGAEVLLLPSAWPKARLDHFLALLKARAIENQCYVVGANKIGHHDSGIPYGGHSAVFGPWGEKLGELGSKPGVLRVTLDLSRVREVRKRYPFLKSRVLF